MELLKNSVESIKKFKIKDIIEQIVKYRFNLKVTITILFFVIGGIFVLHDLADTSSINMVFDMAYIANLPFYFSIMSTLGNMTWAAAAGICFFAYAMIRKKEYEHRFVLYTLASAILITYLGLDDALLFHDDFFPNYLHIPEMYILVAYMLMYAVFILYFIKEILATDYLFFLVYVVCFVISQTIDIFLQHLHLIKWQDFIEDSFKFVGIVFWLLYCAVIAKQFINQGTEKKVVAI